MFADEEKMPSRPESEDVTVTMERELLDALDAWAAVETAAASRAEAVRHILRDWLREHGHLPSPDGEQGTRPEDLTSENDG